MRNLSYTSSEEDLEKLFSAYGGCCIHLVLGGICFRHLEVPLLCGQASVLSQCGAAGRVVSQAGVTVVPSLIDTKAPGCQKSFLF